eukprot:1677122-Pleurochrysis_carterae.AAC.2
MENGDDEGVVLVLHCIAQPAGHNTHSVQLCVEASKPLMAAFAQAPSDAAFGSPMRWTDCKARAKDLTQGPCDGLYVEPLRRTL